MLGKNLTRITFLVLPDVVEIMATSKRCPDMSVAEKLNVYIILFNKALNAVCLRFLRKFVWSHWPLGWSDIVLFAIFENGHTAADQVIFLWVQFQKIGELASRARGACAAKIYLLNIQRNLKNEYCFLPNFIYLPFTAKNNRQTENSKFNILLHCFSPPKWANLFLT